MTSWLDETARDREPRDLRGFVLLAASVPVMFFGLFFGLDFLLRLIAGWFV